MKALNCHQVRVLIEIVAGKTPKEMSGNPKTNEFHLAKVKAVTGLRSNVLLAQFAILAGIAAWDARAVKLVCGTFVANPNRCLISGFERKEAIA